MIYQFQNFISKHDCDNWISKAPKFKDYEWENRRVDITNDIIVNKVKNFLQDNLNIKTECYDAHIQLWPVNSGSPLHIHVEEERQHGDYNSLIYLNDNFDGGEFVSFDGFFKPEPGLLTFFNGKQVYHGVNKVMNNHRYTLIFWWKNTIFF